MLFLNLKLFNYRLVLFIGLYSVISSINKFKNKHPWFGIGAFMGVISLIISIFSIPLFISVNPTNFPTNFTLSFICFSLFLMEGFFFILGNKYRNNGLNFLCLMQAICVIVLLVANLSIGTDELIRRQALFPIILALFSEFSSFSSEMMTPIIIYLIDFWVWPFPKPIFILDIILLSISLTFLLMLLCWFKALIPDNYIDIFGDSYEGLTDEEQKQIILDKLKNRVKLGEEFLTPTKFIICPTCNSENLIDSKICKSCSNYFPICIICRKVVSKEDLIYCSFCNAPSHRLEFLEWLKVKAYCPNCKRELDVWEFQKYIKEQNFQHLDSKICKKCKKNIPNDALFCIYCGIKVS